MNEPVEADLNAGGAVVGIGYMLIGAFIALMLLTFGIGIALAAI